MSKKEKKFLVKIHPEFQQSQARDVESGVMFTKYDAVEIGEDIWKRLKGKEWTSQMISYIIKQTLKEQKELSDLNINNLEL